jgi:hypothetical protein
MRAAIVRPIGSVLLAGALLVAGLAGVVAFWAVFPRTADTSPLAALFLLTWSCTYVAAATLTWRRSPLAAAAFVGAVGLLLFPASFAFPGGGFVVPSFIAIVLLALLGYRYLQRSVGSPSRSR